MNICAICKAPVLQPDTQEIHPFHEGCYARWISRLYEELRHMRVPIQKAEAA